MGDGLLISDKLKSMLLCKIAGVHERTETFKQTILDVRPLAIVINLNEMRR